MRQPRNGTFWPDLYFMFPMHVTCVTLGLMAPSHTLQAKLPHGLTLCSRHLSLLRTVSTYDGEKADRTEAGTVKRRQYNDVHDTQSNVNC